MIKWYNLREVAEALGFKDARTFRDNYMADYPPDRENGRRKWWTDATVQQIKMDVLGCSEETQEEEEKEMA